MGYLRLKKGDTSRKAKEREAEVQKAAPPRAPRAPRTPARSAGKRTPWGTLNNGSHTHNEHRSYNGGNERRASNEDNDYQSLAHRHVYDMTPEEIRAAQIQMARMALRRSSEK